MATVHISHVATLGMLRGIRHNHEAIDFRRSVNIYFNENYAHRKTLPCCGDNLDLNRYILPGA